MTYVLAILAVIAAFVFLRGAGSNDRSEAVALVRSGEAVLIDVRTAGEFASGHLDGAKNLPVHELEARRAELPATDRPVVVYCRSGTRSARAKRVLEGFGHTRVLDAGAMAAWPR